MPKLIAKRVNGQLDLVHINSNLIHGAEEECACCPAECCHEIDGGTFDANGDLVFTTAALTAVVEMPS